LSKTAIKALKNTKSLSLVGCSFILTKTARGGKKARLRAPEISFSPPENIWSALRATKEKIAQMGDNFLESPILVEFYDFARTHFDKNS
jgi:hypothetical protein